MDVFEVHDRLIRNYSAFTASPVEVRDERITEHLREEKKDKVHWPDLWLPLNLNFELFGTVAELVEDEGERTFTLYRNQCEAIEAAREKWRHSGME